ncbi:MAG: helix-turn-helix domain-containing protein [Christensenellales bacterium]|jgi:two-component system response regulator YesN
MRRLLIIDDEPIIADGLFSHVQEQSLADLEVYRAYSASQALSLLRMWRMDVVISDIQMPGMNGLELAEYILRAWPRCQIIFLTGYDNFDYLYRAQKLGTIQYLLKNEGYPVIMDALHKALSQLSQQERNQQLIARAQQQEQMLLPLLRRELLLDLLRGETPSSIQQRLESLSIPMQTDAPVLLLTAVICSSERTHNLKEEEIRVNLVMEEQLDQAFVFLSVTTHTHFVWLLQEVPDKQPGQQEPVPAVQRLRGLTESVHQICADTFGLPLSFVLTHRAIPWNEVGDTFLQHQTILQACLLPGMDGVVLDGAAQPPLHSQEVSPPPQMIECLEQMLLRNEFDTFQNALTELEQIIVGPPSADELYARVFHTVLAALLAWSRQRTLDILPSISVLSLKTPPAIAFAAFREIVESFRRIQQDDADTRSGQAVQAVQQYIHDHPGGDLSLSALADLVYFNPKYLSRLFKQVTNTNLSDYVLSVRLDHARHLLAHSNKKVHEVGAAIGYLSAPAFTRLFKNATGMTPQEYRDSMRIPRTDGGQTERK